MGVTKELFGNYTDPESGKTVPVHKYVLTVQDGVEVHLLSYGAGICGVIAPDAHGKRENVVLGFDSLEEYLKTAYQGSTIGRVANRIQSAQFSIAGDRYRLPANNGPNCLHGGPLGWDKRIWSGHVADDAVVFSLVSADGDQGFPGTVMAQVRYRLAPPGRLQVDYQALTSAPCPINMTNHAFFNLAGHASGKTELVRHTCQLHADAYLPVTADLIPTGEQRSVEGTPFDLRTDTGIGEAMGRLDCDGYDHCFVLGNTERGLLRIAARFTHPASGRVLEVWTTEPGVQFYTGNFLPPAAQALGGRGGAAYTKQGAFCCEPQNLPDAVNQTGFPESVVQPGELYKHTLVYNFTLV